MSAGKKLQKCRVCVERGRSTRLKNRRLGVQIPAGVRGVGIFIYLAIGVAIFLLVQHTQKTRKRYQITTTYTKGP
jgi:hypothetical protein